MPARFTLEQIREYWSQQADVHGQSPSTSWSDHRVIEMEIQAIGKYLYDGNYVLDIGCANGFSTVQFAASNAIRILGADYIPGMIENAQRRLEGIKDSFQGRVEFKVGDILHLQFPDRTFDKVISTRTVINLGSFDNQVRGLRECARVLKHGGTLLLSEATLQGWRRMNAFRREWGLPDIPIPPFNTYIDEEEIVRALSPHLGIQEIVNFASTYYVGTRILKPLLARTCGTDVDATDPAMEWNRWFSQLHAAGDYGTQKLFVFRKK